MKNKLKKLRDFYCYTDFYLNRGLAIHNGPYQILKFLAFSGIVVNMVNEVIDGWWGIRIPMDYVFIFVPPIAVYFMSFGWLDVKKIHALQKSNEISTQYNPFLVNLIKNGHKKNDRKRKS